MNEKELQEAVESMLNDESIRSRMKQISARIQEASSLERAGDEIEALGIKPNRSV